MNRIKQITLIIFSILLVGAFSLCAKAYETVYDQGKGVEVVSWCTSSGAKSSLQDLIGKGSECRRALLRHGDKSQNELGLSAIKEICLGNDDLAQDFIRACDCHNPGDFPSVWADWAKVVNWAKTHPYCEQWKDWTKLAAECRANGNEWSDEGRICIVKSVGPQTSVSCVSKNVTFSNSAQTNVELSNGCGKCIVLAGAHTLNGQIYQNFTVKEFEPGEATTIVMYLDQIGTHEVALFYAWECKQ